LAGRPVRLVNGSWLGAEPRPRWAAVPGRQPGQIVAQLVEVLDLTRALAGPAVEVYTVVAADPAGTTAATLRFASGAVGTITAISRLDRPRRVGLELYADGAGVTVAEDGCEIRIADRTEWHAVDPMTARRAVNRAFIDAVRRPENRGGVLVDYPEAARSHQLARALARSAAEHRPITPG
jgi:myo-inositol 2-dehydrogenase/D-chiro-inositol 1-dehydrogenase